MPVDEDKPDLDTFVTKGKHPNRVIQCQVPFIQSKTSFYDGRHLENWKLIDGKEPIPMSEFKDVIIEIIKARRNSIKQFLQQNPGYTVVEEKPGWIQLKHESENASTKTTVLPDAPDILKKYD